MYQLAFNSCGVKLQQYDVISAKNMSTQITVVDVKWPVPTVQAIIASQAPHLKTKRQHTDVLSVKQTASTSNTRPIHLTSKRINETYE